MRRLAAVTLALALVVLAALAERQLFTGIADLTTDYRIVSTFAGMHLGGSQIGIFLVIAMPFAAILLMRGRPLLRFATLALQVAVVYVPFLNEAFDTTAMDLTGWLLCVGLASVVLWTDELRKLVTRSRTDATGNLSPRKPASNPPG